MGACWCHCAALRAASLTSSALQLSNVDLSDFVNLRVLRLRNNRLTSVVGIGLHRMSSLTALDLRDNPLNVREPETVLNHLEAATGLVMLGLADRPSRAADERFRLRVLAALPRLQQVTCPLR